MSRLLLLAALLLGCASAADCDDLQPQGPAPDFAPSCGEANGRCDEVCYGTCDDAPSDSPCGGVCKGACCTAEAA